MTWMLNLKMKTKMILTTLGLMHGMMRIGKKQLRMRKLHMRRKRKSFVTRMPPEVSGSAFLVENQTYVKQKGMKIFPWQGTVQTCGQS